MTSPLPRADIQRLALIGFDTECCRYFVLRVADPALAVEFVQKLAAQGWIKHAASAPGANQPLAGTGAVTALSIGFTAHGLAALGLDARIAPPSRNSRRHSRPARARARPGWATPARAPRNTGCPSSHTTMRTC